MAGARSSPNWAPSEVYVDLDAPCGRHRRYRDLVECGETWRRLAAEKHVPDNVPRSMGTLNAMLSLCIDLLDPLEDALGTIELTYGFSSPALSSRIRRGIAPELDQHAGDERRTDGRPVCRRGGFAVDFRVIGRGSREVARWIGERADFDRLYYYGDDRPLHLSLGPDASRALFEIQRTGDGRALPRRRSLEFFKAGL